MKLNSTGSKIIESDLKNGSLICFLLGAPGIGKSAIMRDIAMRNGWGYQELLCNQIAMQADLTGCRTVTYKNNLGEDVAKQVFFPHAVIREAIDEAKEFPNKKVLLFLDEINRTSASVTSAVLTFITARTIGTEKLPDNIIISAAGNDEGNIISLDQASISRFIVRRCEPDYRTFLGLGKIHPAIESVLKANPAYIFQRERSDDEDSFSYDRNDDDFSQLSTPRTIMGLNKALLDNQDMIDEFNESTMKEYVRGFTGETAFTDAIVAFLMSKKYQKLVTNEKIVIEKPECIDIIMAEKDNVRLDMIIRNLKEKDKAAAILYMLFDVTRDYTKKIELLAKAYKKNTLTNTDGMKTLGAIINTGKYNKDSYEVLLSSGSPLSKTIKMIYGG